MDSYNMSQWKVFSSYKQENGLILYPIIFLTCFVLLGLRGAHLEGQIPSDEHMPLCVQLRVITHRTDGDGPDVTTICV